MPKPSGRLTYSNVVSTICLVLLVSGGVAYATSQLGKNSVGTKQLKASSVTTGKLKKYAVTKAKIKKNSVDSSKITDGSVTAADLKASGMPFSQIVYEARGSGTVSLPTGSTTVYPITGPTYTQPAGRDDTYYGFLDVTVPTTCTGNRNVYARLTVDAADPTKATGGEVVASGEFHAAGTAQASARINLGPQYNGVRFQPTSPTSHTMAVVADVSCTSGGGVTASAGGIDVIGTS